MKLNAFLIPISIFFLSCNSNTKQSTNNTDTTTEIKKTTSIIENQCFEYQKNGFTADVKLNFRGDSVSGQMQNLNAEKDSNFGKLAGVLKDNIIIADYEFQSEGQISTMQVQFKMEDGKLMQGFGEMEDKNGKMVFKPNAAINYDMVYEKKNCDNITF